MGDLQIQFFILSVLAYGTFGGSSLIENEASDKNGLPPSTVSGKASNVLRDILNQETLVRFSMVQKIQNLVMNAIDSKNDIQVMKAKLSEMSMDLRNLEMKNQILEEENIELKEKFRVVNRTVKVNKNFTEEELRYIDQVIESKTLALQEQLDLSQKTMESDLRKAIQTLKMTEQNTKEKIKALNESQLVVKSPQIEMLQNQMNDMNVTLQKCSVNSFFERVKKTEYALENFSVSVNETLHTVCGNLNESSWTWSKVLLKDCGEILKKFPSLKGRDGIYRISVGSEVKSVYCDMTTDGGGWTAIQRREDGSTDFYRTWLEYKQGFGDPSKNYWIGNDAIYELTKNKDQELWVELQRFNGDTAYAQYSTFYVEDEDSKYKLTVSGYSGSAGDSLAYHNGMKFSTNDQDNDRGGNCATSFHGAWWYKNCHLSNLNGLYGQSGDSGVKYTTWYHLKNNREALKQTMMMIRHRN